MTERPPSGMIYSRMSTPENLPETRLEFLQGTLDVLVLQRLKFGPMHAHGIAQWIEGSSANDFVVEHGSLYPALQRLLQRGWIESHWDTSPNGRRARYYSLTTAGRKQVVHATSRWQRFSDAMSRLLSTEEA